ncbi:tetratricopeptide repeat protein [Candidatus Protochlamydia phocaeensis]|uniref:tetratricopeptide repeat protein n=1 Tax=Candidatus Protochlamydia phocaeensis TaxID=1414722 RepID=UPI00083806C6|nr:hypothetical protein [Candidatus Protochlamydia phocaeensis]
MFADCVNNYMSAFDRIVKNYPASNKDCIPNSANNLETDDKVVQIQQRTYCLVNVGFEGSSINGRKRKFNQISSTVPASASDVLMGSKRHCQDLNCASSEIKGLDSETGEEASKIEEKSPTAFDFLQLDINVVDQIYSHLSHKDLLQFERLAKGYKDITGPIWRSYAQRECLDRLWWGDSDQTPNREFGYKWNYCLSKVVIQYVKEGYPRRCSKSLELAQEIHARYGRVIKRFPFFKAYVKQDIFRIGCSSRRVSIGGKNLLRERLKEEGLKNGDYLLNVLFEARKLKLSINKNINSDDYKNSVRLLEEYVAEAIKKSGAYANLLVFYALDFPLSYEGNKAFPNLNWCDSGMQDMFFSLHKRMLRISAVHDPKGLEYLLSNYPIFSTYLHLQGYDMPKLFSHLMEEAIKEGDWTMADTLCEKALASYKGQAPASIRFTAIRIKLQLNQTQEAENLYQEALLTAAAKSDLEILFKIASIKAEEGKCQEAEMILTSIAARFNKTEQDAVVFIVEKICPWDELLSILIKLEKWQQADNVCKQILPVVEKDLRAKAFVQMAFIKAKLGDLKAASQHYAKAIKAYGNDVPAGIFADAAFIKWQLRRYKESNGLYEKAIKASGGQLSLSAWDNMLAVKIKLKKWQEAERHLECIQAAYGTSLPSGIAEKMRLIKNNLNH